MTERLCSMVKEPTKPDKICGKPARRSLARAGLPGHERGCCDDCFAELVALRDDVFTETVLNELYPL